MTGPGRPPVGPRVEIRLPDDLLAAVDRFAEAEGCGRAEAIRRLIVLGMAQYSEFT